MASADWRVAAWVAAGLGDIKRLSILGRDDGKLPMMTKTQMQLQRSRCVLITGRRGNRSDAADR
jgi:hypothetical protein